MHALALRGYLDDLHFLELAHTILHLLGFRCLVAKTLDESLHMSNFLLLLLGLLTQQFKALFTLRQISRIIAFVELNMAQINLSHPINHVVQELAVVAYHNHASRITTQKTLKPLHAFEVEVVGGLVKKEHFRVAR